MQKIISLFQRNYDGDRLVRDEVVSGAEWVLTGEGTATRKYDGTAAMVRDGKLYKRYDVKKGRTPPAGWEQAQEPDPVTGHWPGWIPVNDGNEDRWFREAFTNLRGPHRLPLSNGTYELVGPKVQSNPEGFASHILIRHGWDELDDAPRDFAGLKAYLAEHDVEGIVWHHPVYSPVKIKGKDFGIKRPVGVQA